MRLRKHVALIALASVATTSCIDLNVANPNAADAERALRTASDIEALIGGSWGSWWNASSSSNGIGPIFASVAYQTSATAANFGMVQFSGYPKERVHHQAADVYYGQFAYSWTQLYRAVSSVVDGLKAIEGGKVELDAANLARAKAFGYFVLGISHGAVSILYDQGYIYDPTVAVEDVALKPYKEVNDAALKYLDKAIAEAQGQTFTIPNTWMSTDVSSADLVKLAYSYKARYRAQVARTPAERAAVNWDQVIADVDKGVASWAVNVRSGSGFASGTMSNVVRYGPWGQLTYQVYGMADQSGQYQKWLAKDPLDRHPNLADDQVGDPFLIMTPDNRFPSGATVAAQQGKDGRIFEIATSSGGYGAQWARPDRGTFRWSYYRNVYHNQWLSTATRTDHNEIPPIEPRMLKAEGLFRKGDKAGAATLINVTRVASGLNATDANGANTSCVPKLPSGQCGDLWEMLKWELRLESTWQGLHMAPWYFNARGWGDLHEGVFLHLPVPGREMDLLQIPSYTFGGIGGDGSAPKGTYGF